MLADVLRVDATISLQFSFGFVKEVWELMVRVWNEFSDDPRAIDGHIVASAWHRHNIYLRDSLLSALHRSQVFYRK